MRDPDRIDATLKAVEKLWRQNPDLRLGQIMWMIAGRDPFYIEDEETIRRSESLI